jgi:hypothetical protein
MAPPWSSERLWIVAGVEDWVCSTDLIGWILWDEEHGDQVGKSRGTLGEIHPIHRIEVYEAGEWKDLDQQ